jgi:hypothetical protein
VGKTNGVDESEREGVYVCDEVLQDPATGKSSFLGIFDDIVPPPATGYPFRLSRMCVVAQPVGGSARCRSASRLSKERRRISFGGAGPFTVSFPTRHQVVTICFQILNVVFPAPGVYFVELYSQGAFLDDRLLRPH